MALGAPSGDNADPQVARRRQPTHRILSEVDGGTRISSASTPTPTAWREPRAVAEAVATGWEECHEMPHLGYCMH